MLEVASTRTEVATGLIRLVDIGLLAVIENESICRILHMRHRGCVSTMELQRRICLTAFSEQLIERSLCWLGHATRRADDELVIHLTEHLGPENWEDPNYLTTK